VACFLSVLSRMFTSPGLPATASISITNLTMKQGNPHGEAGRVSSFLQRQKRPPLEKLRSKPRSVPIPIRMRQRKSRCTQIVLVILGLSCKVGTTPQRKGTT
jgi:hypothetical protein